MKNKRNFFLLLFLFLILTTFYYDLNKTSLAETFKIKNIEITGLENSDSNLINLKVEKLKGQNIFFLDQNKFASSMISIDFINSIEIKKIYPNNIKIKINEEKIIAILIKDDDKYILTEKGEIIYKYDTKFSSLPLIYGKNTKESFPIFYKFLLETNFSTDQIEYYKYFETGRWDIFLKNGKLIRLPSGDEKIKNSIKKFILISNKKNFEQFKIFDFRLENQLIVK